MKNQNNNENAIGGAAANEIAPTTAVLKDPRKRAQSAPLPITGTSLHQARIELKSALSNEDDNPEAVLQATKRLHLLEHQVLLQDQGNDLGPLPPQDQGNNPGAFFVSQAMFQTVLQQLQNLASAMNTGFTQVNTKLTLVNTRLDACASDETVRALERFQKQQAIFAFNQSMDVRAEGDIMRRLPPKTIAGEMDPVPWLQGANLPEPLPPGELGSYPGGQPTIRLRGRDSDVKKAIARHARFYNCSFGITNEMNSAEICFQFRRWLRGEVLDGNHV